MGDGQQPVTPWTFWGRLKRRLKHFKPSAPGPLKQREKERKAAEMAAGLRRPKGPKTWIFVVDANANLYVGLKDVGRFQHSSFLFGARVMAAGLIKVKQGRLTSLVPLSGHYKCTWVGAFLEVLALTLDQRARRISSALCKYCGRADATSLTSRSTRAWLPLVPSSNMAPCANGGAVLSSTSKQPSYRDTSLQII